jgi:hypothetical protein
MNEGFYFIKNYIEYFKNSDYNELMQDFVKNNKKISQFYCEYIITMQIYLSSNNYKNNNDFKIINSMFEISAVDDGEHKNKLLFFSCIGGMFKFYKKNIFEKYQYEPFLVAYPNILLNHSKY